MAVEETTSSEVFTAAEGSRSIMDGALYLVEDRLQTFKDATWPFKSGSCSSLKVAEAGFYYCGTPQAPDWVRCIVCHLDMDGWEASDDPLSEHKANSPKCAFLKVKDPYAITVSDSIDLEKAAIQNFIALETLKLESDMKEFAAETRERLEKTFKQGMEHS